MKREFRFRVLSVVLGLLVLLGGNLAGHAQTTTQSVYPAGAGIRVKEVDGSPNIVGVQTLVFPNGTLTRSGQTVTVTVSGGGGTTINSTNGALPYRVNSTTFGDSGITSNARNSTYLDVTSAASGSGVTVAVAGGGTNENLILTPKGTGQVVFPVGTATSPAMALGTSAGQGIWSRASGLINFTGGGGTWLEGTYGDFKVSGNTSIGISPGDPTLAGADIKLRRHAAGVFRISDAATGAGQLLIGTSSDTVSAQLDVRSQLTTRPAARFQAASTTSGTQEMLGVYDGSGGNTFKVTADGQVQAKDGTAVSPGLSFTGDTSTGIYNVGSSLRFSTGGTIRAFIDSTSNGRVVAYSFVLDPSNSDVILQRDTANTLAQRNGTNAQAFRVYNTYTDASNHEFIRAGYASNVAYIHSTANGTGTIRTLRLMSGASDASSGAYIDLTSAGTIQFARSGVANRWTIDANGHWLAATDNTYDIGASGATRPRNVYIGSEVIAGSHITGGISSAINWRTRATMWSPADSVIQLGNAANTDFDRLQFGGTSASFPAEKRVGATIQTRLADDTAFAAVQSLYIRFGSGSPEGAVSAPVGAIYSRTDGGTNTTLYVKESGSGNTGWIAK